MEHSLKDIVATLSHQTADNIRPSCVKCGYPGHFTYQCRNFIKTSSNHGMLLDVSSTSSDPDSDAEDLSKAAVRPFALEKNAEKLTEDSKSEKKKKHKKEKKSKKKKKKHRRRDDSSDSEDEFNSAKRQRRSRSRSKSKDRDDVHRKASKKHRRDKHDRKRHSRDRSSART
ncbi:Protein SREK1IP1 [Halotydeus destructor]|nr:Protein SREK1IP1 [Halotydeus destructor]